MFLSPFTVSLACDAGVIVVYLQRAEIFGGTPWFTITFSRDYTSEMVDVVRDLCCCVRGACSSSCTLMIFALQRLLLLYLDMQQLVSSIHKYAAMCRFTPPLLRNESVGRNSYWCTLSSSLCTHQVAVYTTTAAVRSTSSVLRMYHMQFVMAVPCCFVHVSTCHTSHVHRTLWYTRYIIPQNNIVYCSY